jgi:hypothetical protein
MPHFFRGMQPLMRESSAECLIGSFSPLAHNLPGFRFAYFDETYGGSFSFWFSGAYAWPQVVVLGIVVKVSALNYPQPNAMGCISRATPALFSQQ